MNITSEKFAAIESAFRLRGMGPHTARVLRLQLQRHVLPRTGLIGDVMDSMIGEIDTEITKEMPLMVKELYDTVEEFEAKEAMSKK